MKNISKQIIPFALLSSVSACYHANEFVYHDPLIQMHEYEMVAKLQNKEGRKIKTTKDTSIKKLDTIYTPEEPQALSDKVVSINVTEEVPIVDVIMELSRMSGTDIQIDPTIIGGVNLNFKDKPLRYVFNRICGLTDTRYREKYGVVVFERDIPKAKTYTLDFLDIERNSNSTITLNTSGLSTSSVTGGGTATVSTSSTDSFWTDLVADIKQIVQTTENTHKIYTQTAEKIQNLITEEEQKQKIEKDIINGVYNQDAKKINEEKTTILTQNNAQLFANINDNNFKLSDDIIRVNKRAGLITVTAGEKSHRLIEQYLKDLRRKVTAQVLIEMRFLEINLNKKYEAGIDWTDINLFGRGVGNATMSTLSNTSLATLTFNKGIDAVANLFEQFGSTRTLSNPRINAVNNQPALMTFATNHVYFKTKSSYTPSTTSSSGALTQAYRNVESEAQTMPLGIIMSVLPSIDVDRREVMLSIRPTISKLQGEVKDPAVTVVLDEVKGSSKTEDTQSTIPVASVREMDTILKIKDGQTAVIGGFTERTADVSENGIPVMRAIPILGNLFSHKKDTTSSTETILLVKASIVDNGKKMSDYDKDIYDSFSDDPRMNEV